MVAPIDQRLAEFERQFALARDVFGDIGAVAAGGLRIARIGWSSYGGGISLKLGLRFGPVLQLLRRGTSVLLPNPIRPLGNFIGCGLPALGVLEAMHPRTVPIQRIERALVPFERQFEVTVRPQGLRDGESGRKPRAGK